MSTLDTSKIPRASDHHSSLRPGRLTAGTYKSPMKRKENDLNQTSMVMFHVNLQACILSSSTSWLLKNNICQSQTLVTVLILFSKPKTNSSRYFAACHITNNSLVKLFAFWQPKNGWFLHTCRVWWSPGQRRLSRTFWDFPNSNTRKI